MQILKEQHQWLRLANRSKKRRYEGKTRRPIASLSSIMTPLYSKALT
jgi:hypothetical protein